MKTSVEKGLASHSSIMVAPQELTSECEDGWTVVSSKRTLRKLRKMKKSTNQKCKESTDKTSAEVHIKSKSSSANDSVKSTSSKESWSSIVKRALKMDVPRVSIEICSKTTSKTQESSENEVQFIKTVKPGTNKHMEENQPAISPPKIIMVPQGKAKSSVQSFFHDDESMSTQTNQEPDDINSIKSTEDYESTNSGHIETNPDRANCKENKRVYETAFSATSPTEITKIDKDKKTKTTSTGPPDTVTVHFYEQQKNLKDHKNQEQAMYEVNHHHHTIINQAKFIHKNDMIDECRHNIENIDDTNYTEFIKKELPILHNVLNPISKKFLIDNFHEFQQGSEPQEWGDFSKNRGNEIKRLEKTVIFNQLKENNFTHVWKLMYKEVNEYCNDYGIPNENRIKLYIKELEYISLYIHDVLPVNYNEQGIYPFDKSISKHTNFFSRNDTLPVARKKWLDYISEDYNFFWDVYAQKINYRTLNDLDIVKLQDIYDIVYFINPQGIRTILENSHSYQIVNHIYQKFLKIKNWVPSRHYSYYTWIIYGWKELPHHFPSFNSSKDPREISLRKWVPRSVPYKQFISYDHYSINQKPRKGLRKNDLVPSRISSKKNKMLIMPRNHFEEKILYYDSI